MYNFKASTVDTGFLRSSWYIQSSSITGSSGISTGFDTWSNPRSLYSGPYVISNINAIGTYEGASITAGPSTSVLEDYQGKYVRIFMTIYRSVTGGWSNDDRLDLKGFVYRTSREIGGSVISPAIPVR
jgi:hypothetical protein